MVAALSVRKYTGSAAGTQSSAVTGADLSSADNAVNSLGNRQANPIPVGANSYETWLRLFIDTAPDNAVTNFLVWGDGAVQASTTLMVKGDQVTGVTPTAATSTVAVTTFTQYTSGNKLQWDAGSYSQTGSFTDFLVFQLQVAADAAPGNWTQETVSYSYDET